MDSNDVVIQVLLDFRVLAFDSIREAIDLCLQAWVPGQMLSSG